MNTLVYTPRVEVSGCFSKFFLQGAINTVYDADKRVYNNGFIAFLIFYYKNFYSHFDSTLFQASRTWRLWSTTSPGSAQWPPSSSGCLRSTGSASCWTGASRSSATSSRKTTRKNNETGTWTWRKNNKQTSQTSRSTSNIDQNINKSSVKTRECFKNL